MPFTPAHTAIVLPFLRLRYVSATALVIGSMAPDFEYFFKLSVDGVHGHSWPGLIYFDLPVTVGLAFVFHLVVKNNFILSLPPFLQRRFRETLKLDFREYFRKHPFVFIISALVSSASHILWDGFTHGNGFFVEYFSFYDGAYVPFQGVNYPLWYALQHISTITGLFILAMYVILKPSADYSARPGIRYWIIFLTVGGGVVFLRFLIYPFDYNLGNLVVTSCSAVCIASIASGLIPLKEQSGEIAR